MATDDTNSEYSTDTSNQQPYSVTPHQTQRDAHIRSVSPRDAHIRSVSQPFLLMNTLPAPPYPLLNPTPRFQTVFATSDYRDCRTSEPTEGKQVTPPVNSQTFLEDVSKNLVPDIETLGERGGERRKRVCYSRVEEGRRRLQCSECGECHTTPQGLASHLATQHHHCVQTYRCLYCPQIFFSKQNLLSHIKSVLLDKKPSPVHVAGMISCAQHTCPACARVHVSAQNLKMHLVKNKCVVVGLSEKVGVDKRTKLECMKLVLQSYRPRVVRLKCVETTAHSSNTTSAVVTRTEQQSLHLKRNLLSDPQKEDNAGEVPHSTGEVPHNTGEVPQHCPRVSQINEGKRCVPAEYYEQPSTYLRPPVVMANPIATNQYYNMDYYPYPSNTSGVAMATSHHIPPHYAYQQRVGCHGDNRIQKQLYSCLNCGSKYPEFDMLAQHFRDNSCSSGGLESILSCCPQRHY